MAEKNGDPDNDDDGNGYVDDWIGWDFVNDTEDDPSGFIYCYEAEGEDCGTPDNDPRDFNGHGTHCAGIVSASESDFFLCELICKLYQWTPLQKLCIMQQIMAPILPHVVGALKM